MCASRSSLDSLPSARLPESQNHRSPSGAPPRARKHRDAIASKATMAIQAHAGRSGCRSPSRCPIDSDRAHASPRTWCLWIGLHQLCHAGTPTGKVVGSAGRGRMQVHLKQVWMPVQRCVNQILSVAWRKSPHASGPRLPASEPPAEAQRKPPSGKLRWVPCFPVRLDAHARLSERHALGPPGMRLRGDADVPRHLLRLERVPDAILARF